MAEEKAHRLENRWAFLLLVMLVKHAGFRVFNSFGRYVLKATAPCAIAYG